MGSTSVFILSLNNNYKSYFMNHYIEVKILSVLFTDKSL